MSKKSPSEVYSIGSLFLRLQFSFLNKFFSVAVHIENFRGNFFRVNIDYMILLTDYLLPYFTLNVTLNPCSERLSLIS